VKDQIIKLVVEATKSDASQITGESRFIDDLNLDSLDIVELMMKVEDHFNVEIPEQEAEGLKTVNDVVKYIESKIQS